MNTETTETIRGWVFYDAECPFCSKWAARVHGLLSRRGYHLVSLQAPWARARLGLGQGAAIEEMKLAVGMNGPILGGADALIFLAGIIWWACPFWLLAHLPGLKPFLRSIYLRLAARRHCFGKSCPSPGGLGGKSPRGHITSAFYELP